MSCAVPKFLFVFCQTIFVYAKFPYFGYTKSTGNGHHHIVFLATELIERPVKYKRNAFKFTGYILTACVGSCLAERNYFFSSCKWFFTGNFFYFDIVCGIREKNFERIFFCFVYLPPVSPWASTSAVISRRYRKINEIEFNYWARWPPDWPTIMLNISSKGERNQLLYPQGFFINIFIFNATNKRPRNKNKKGGESPCCCPCDVFICGDALLPSFVIFIFE
jgi:hypothetical protein